jgi:hypothetical protein
VLAVEAQAYWYPKDRNAPTEWEDAAAYSVRRQRFAVADGASNAYRARDWARALASGYVEDFPAGFTDSPRPQRTTDARRWLVTQAERWQRDSPSPTAWYEEDAARGGSAAAFLGLQFLDTDWEAVAIGDCCLFQVRAGKPVVCFPVSEPSRFTRYPDLMPTAPARLAGAAGSWSAAVALEYGTAQHEDVFVLASDAFSGWLLAEAESEPAVWEALGWFDGERLGRFVADLQRGGAMQVDDVTVMVIRVRDPRQPSAAAPPSA